MIKGKSVPKAQRDQSILDFAKLGINRADMCRKSGLPLTSLLISRSVFPILLRIVFQRFIGGEQTVTEDAMLERLRTHGHIDDLTHDNLRDAAKGLSEYGSGRDAGGAVHACNVLLEITKTKAFAKAGRKSRTKKVKRCDSRLRRLAAAATTLLTLGFSGQ